MEQERSIKQACWSSSTIYWIHSEKWRKRASKEIALSEWTLGEHYRKNEWRPSSVCPPS